MSEVKSELATVDQQRARHAWDVVQKVKHGKEPDKKKKEFGGQAKKLPARIVTAGLGQALAFLHGKDYSIPLQVALNDWMQHRMPDAAKKSDKLIRRVMESDAAFLQAATAECLAYLQWLVRFADAEGLTDIDPREE